MLQINVYYGAEHFTYKSLIAPTIGDTYPRIDMWDKKSFTVVRRLLHTESDLPQLITVIVEPK